MATQIQIRRDSASIWQSSNPTLSQGEIGYELNTHLSKVGDGITTWNNLPYFTSSLAVTASFALNGGGSSLVTASTYPITASWALNAISTISASWASSSYTASYISSSTITGSFTGSVTGSLVGTASWALNAVSVTSASWASSSYTASYISSSKMTGSFTGSVTGSLVGTASWAITSSFSISSSYAATCSVFIFSNVTSSFITSSLSSSWASQSLYALSVSWASSSYTASYISSSTITGSFTGSFTGSHVGTSSWAISASWAPGSATSTSASWASQSLSASYAVSASYASSASFVTPYQPYVVIPTSSLLWITCSFALPNQQVNITQTGSYNFTHSNIPTVLGQLSDIIVYISHSSLTASTVGFPTTWQNIGPGWPTSIIANTVAVMWLRAIDTGSTVIGTFNYFGNSGTSLTASLLGTASWAVSASWARTSTTASYISSSTITGSFTGSFVGPLTGTASWASNVVNTDVTNSVAVISSGSNYIILQRTTASIVSAFYTYAAISASNARAGRISTVWIGSSSIVYDDASTSDIGNTLDLYLFTFVTGSLIQLIGYSSASFSWSVSARAMYL